MSVPFESKNAGALIKRKPLSPKKPSPRRSPPKSPLQKKEKATSPRANAAVTEPETAASAAVGELDVEQKIDDDIFGLFSADAAPTTSRPAAPSAGDVTDVFADSELTWLRSGPT